MITLEIKTSLTPEEEQKFLTELLNAIDNAEHQLRNSSKIPTTERFVRTIGVGTSK